MRSLNRREFVVSMSAAAAATACCRKSTPVTGVDAIVPTAMLKSRPGIPSEKAPTGIQPLELSFGRDGFMYVPPTYSPDKASPLLILCHGAGHDSHEWTRTPLPELFNKDAIVAIMPDSRQMTWDMIYGDYGPDVRFIDEAMALAFRRCRIDPRRIALGGFSDGATYALSLGITNANLFSTILAFSPGFVRPAAKTGKPRIFIGHGTRDEVLPIELTSREIVAALEEKNYPVHFEEFDGPHTVTTEEAKHAIAWFMEG
jgi:predicted esterase